MHKPRVDVSMARATNFTILFCHITHARHHTIASPMNICAGTSEHVSYEERTGTYVDCERNRSRAAVDGLDPVIRIELEPAVEGDLSRREGVGVKLVDIYEPISC